MKIRNTNPCFGECGPNGKPFEAESIEALMDFLSPRLLTWARLYHRDGEGIPQAFARVCAEYRAGLEIVPPDA